MTSKKELNDTKAGIVHYENTEIPLRVKEYTINTDSRGHNIMHWHDDFELVQVLEGICEYRIEADTILLQPGDFLFVNSRVMHASRRYGDTVLKARCLLFQKSLLCPNPAIEKYYFAPVYEDQPFAYLFFPRHTPEAERCLMIMDDMYLAKQDKRTAYELEIIAGLHEIMVCIYRCISGFVVHAPQRELASETQKAMLSFIYHHCQEKITLADIAESGNVSPRHCCEIFRRTTGCTPMEYVNLYRLELAARMLKGTDDPIQTVAERCGIENAAYFAKQFKDRFHVTPRQYRLSTKTENPAS